MLLCIQRGPDANGNTSMAQTLGGGVDPRGTCCKQIVALLAAITLLQA